MRVAVQSAPFDIGHETAAFAQAAAGAGAVVTFTGIVRDLSGGLTAMEIEHYPGMTERAIRDITLQAVSRWDLIDALVIHRHGTLRAGEPIMMVATAAAHRAGAFAAADFLMDYLKSRAPFWKKEITASGAAWVAATDQDEAALSRW
ncbi:MAG: molybdenum cofactor biosynthesis protein MoaE [Rhodobacter sp.]|nr:molybdenum cofactor biosynthesis protein MoaE [Rhodobacter sp.]MCA3511803.1 molybdenum cofactor biosynthesis protein MoaE [Rhodobacter sp.]MCA3520605.1 molybdenum cofactor biosynthesis protein MoaE [Rhodobacter sp.]MCA3524160.1 molybdenum cofactor biosynthesis protein MoaE [Rhodobacter sp.]MCA3526199.1 molybdenum cofactor biosynthesis protein MoaE [Rhodobacter sp.]